MSDSDTNEDCSLGSSGSDTDISTDEYYFESDDDDSDVSSCRDWKPLCLDNLPPVPPRFPFQPTQIGAKLIHQISLKKLNILSSFFILICCIKLPYKLTDMQNNAFKIKQ